MGFKKRKRPGDSSTTTTTLPFDAHTGPTPVSDDSALKEGRGSDALAYYADYDTPTAYPTAYPVKLTSHSVAPAVTKTTVTTTTYKAPLNHGVAESKIVEEKDESDESDEQVIAVTHHRRSAPPPTIPPPQINPADSSTPQHPIATDSGIAGIDYTTIKVKSAIHMKINPISNSAGGVGGVRGTVRKPTGFVQVDEDD